MISSGVVEGFSGKAKLTGRKAHGLRSPQGIAIAMFHPMGYPARAENIPPILLRRLFQKAVSATEKRAPKLQKPRLVRLEQHACQPGIAQWADVTAEDYGGPTQVCEQAPHDRTQHDCIESTQSCIVACESTSQFHPVLPSPWPATREQDHKVAARVAVGFRRVGWVGWVGCHRGGSIKPAL